LRILLSDLQLNIESIIFLFFSLILVYKTLIQLFASENIFRYIASIEYIKMIERENRNED